MSISTNSDKKLNIAMLGHKRVPSREGGVEIVVEQLSKRLVKMGHKVVCYNRIGHHTNGKQYSVNHIKEFEGVELRKTWTINLRGLSAYTSAFFGAIAIAFGKYDVVHYHAEGPCVSCFIPKWSGKRVIVTVHGLDHQRAKWGRIGSHMILRGERRAVKYADEIIVLSENVQNYFKEKYGRETVFIPNGVLPAEQIEANLIRDKWGLEKDSYILFLGRIVPEKGVHYIIDAYNNIKTDKKLVIAGGASDSEKYMKDMMKLQSENIIFTNFVQGQELEELYSNAYIYALPSDLEGMPLSLLEAMSYGNCCLTSDIDECTSVIEDHGVTFKKSNVADLTEKLQMLCDDAELVAKYKVCAADYITNKYNWDDVVDKTLSVYIG